MAQNQKSSSSSRSDKRLAGRPSNAKKSVAASSPPTPDQGRFNSTYDEENYGSGFGAKQQDESVRRRPSTSRLSENQYGDMETARKTDRSMSQTTRQMGENFGEGSSRRGRGNSTQDFSSPRSSKENFGDQSYGSYSSGTSGSRTQATGRSRSSQLDEDREMSRTRERHDAYNIHDEHDEDDRHQDYQMQGRNSRNQDTQDDFEDEDDTRFSNDDDQDDELEAPRNRGRRSQPQSRR